VYHLNGAQETQQLTTVAELREALGGAFGIEVPLGTELDAALGRLLA